MKKVTFAVCWFTLVFCLSFAIGAFVPETQAQCMSLSAGAGRTIQVGDLCWFYDPGGCGTGEYCQTELCICCNYCTFTGSPYSSGCYDWDGLCIHTFCPVLVAHRVPDALIK